VVGGVGGKAGTKLQGPSGLEGARGPDYVMYVLVQ